MKWFWKSSEPTKPKSEFACKCGYGAEEHRIMALCGEDINSPCANKPIILWGDWYLCRDCYEGYRKHLMYFIRDFKERR